MQTLILGFPWLSVMAIVGSLLGGGAMGALINSYVSKYRSKRQPVGFSILLAILSVIRVKVKNKGNQDFAEFGIGNYVGRK